VAGPSELANKFHEGVTALRDMVDRTDDRTTRRPERRVNSNRKPFQCDGRAEEDEGAERKRRKPAKSDGL